MPEYKNIFIDLDDTLYDFSAASREAFKETYEQLHYERYFDSFEHYMEIYTPYNLEMWRLYGEGKITKEETVIIDKKIETDLVGEICCCSDWLFTRYVNDEEIKLFTVSGVIG